MVGAATKAARSVMSNNMGALDTDVTIRVEGHEWQRTVNILKYTQTIEESWCDEMNKNAFDVEKSRRVRSSRETRMAADGNFYLKREFIQKARALAIESDPDTTKAGKEAEWKWGNATKGKNEEKEEDWCKCSLQQWRKTAEHTESGRTLYPYFPKVKTTGCAELGCTKEGARVSKLKLNISEMSAGGKGNWSKTFCTAEHGGWSAAQWRAFEVGYESPAKRRMLYGVLCKTITVPTVNEEKRKSSDSVVRSYGDFVEQFGPDTAEQQWKEAKPIREEV